MSEVTVDELVMRLEIELDKFRSQAQQAEAVDRRLRKSLKDTEDAAKKTGEGFDDLGEDVAGANKQLSAQTSALATVTASMVRFLTVVVSSNAIQRMATNVANLNDELNFLSQRLGMIPRHIQAMEAAVSALGGSGATAKATMQQLNQGIQEMVLMGNDALIPFFSALGVGVVDATGDIREMDDILLDMADSLSQMNPQQAYALAEAMGLDGGVANALIQGRDALQEQLDLYDLIYVSRKEDLKASRELSKTQAVLSAQWEGVKTIIGNALIPVVLRMTKIVSGWLDYLNRNERTVRNFFEGLSIAIGVVLIPLLAKAALGMLALISPVIATAGAVALLAGGFALLYDDYKTWAEGGKSLFDWEAFDKYISNTDISVESLANGFVHLLTGYKSVNEAVKGFYDWMQRHGIIDANGLSIKGLSSAFKELGRDVMEAIPALKTMLELVGAAMEGRWGDVLSLAKSIPSQMLGTLFEFGAGAVERGAGAADAALGHEPGSAGSISGAVGGLRQKVRTILFGNGEVGDLSSLMSQYEKEYGLPAGILSSIQKQETGGNQAYIDDPAKYHYGLNSEGRRVAGHTGKVSTAFGPFGLLESTGRDPGYGVKPLQNKELEEQIRFAAEYLAARIRQAGSVEAGLAGYGEGDTYSRQVMGRISGVDQARNMSRNLSVGAGGAGAGSPRSVEVNVGTVNVQTSAATLPAATAEGVAAGVAQGGDMLNQLGGGM